MNVPAQEEVVPTQDLVNQALLHRARNWWSRVTARRELSNKSVRSSLLPTLDLFAYYGGSGVGGSQNPANLCSNLDPALQGFGCAVTPTPSVGYGDTLNQLVNSTAPDKGIGLQLNIPLRNRAAQGVQIRSELELRRADAASAD
jgi:hypothetical protein